MLIFTGSLGYEFYKNMILPDGSEDSSFGFLIYASSDENAMLAWTFEEHRDSETKLVLARLGRAPELWIGANGTNGSKFAILAVPNILRRFNR